MRYWKYHVILASILMNIIYSDTDEIEAEYAGLDEDEVEAIDLDEA